jgi:hypothetical protein
MLISLQFFLERKATILSLPFTEVILQKIDDCIWILAKEATNHGYQVVSFDLPQHGEHVYETEPWMAQKCVEGLSGYFAIRKRANGIRFGVRGSIGVYFSLLHIKTNGLNVHGSCPLLPIWKE